MKQPGILAIAVLGIIATPAAAQVKFSAGLPDSRTTED